MAGLDGKVRLVIGFGGFLVWKACSSIGNKGSMLGRNGLSRSRLFWLQLFRYV